MPKVANAGETDTILKALTPSANPILLKVLIVFLNFQTKHFQI